jgi:dienelactone hydrolase
MSALQDRALAVKVDGIDRPFLVRLPTNLVANPVLLLHLGLSMHHALDVPPYMTVPQRFLDAGHLVATFDLPQHGGWINEFGEGLTGMARALAAGHDVFADLVSMGHGVIDRCLASGIVQPGRIAVSGISRGGHAALHLLAADRRIAAGAAFAPVTDLPAVSEFTAVADAPLVQQANAQELVPALASRPLFISINADDARVSSQHCIRFFQALRAAAPADIAQQLRVDPGDTHTVSDAAYQAGADWLLARF